MKKLLEDIKNSSVYEIIGYTDDEVRKIERLYDIRITGDFEYMIREVGRSCGCDLLNGYTSTEIVIDLYCSVDVRQQVISQYVKREELLDIAFREMKDEKKSNLTSHRLFRWIAGKPYFLSVENQTQSFVILTAEGGRYPVYRYDENEEDIFEMDCDLKDYMRYVINLETNRQNFKTWIGELLVP